MRGKIKGWPARQELFPGHDEAVNEGAPGVRGEPGVVQVQVIAEDLQSVVHGGVRGPIDGAVDGVVGDPVYLTGDFGPVSRGYPGHPLRVRSGVERQAGVDLIGVLWSIHGTYASGSGRGARYGGPG